MAKIGNEGFPVLTLSEALGICDDIKEENIQTVEALAKHLGHKSSNSGAFKAKMAALNKYYGLVNQDNIDIRLTKRGENIAYNISTGDRARAARDAARSVGLVRDLYAQLGADFNRHDFLPRLKEITGASPEEVESKASKVQKVYQDALRYIEVPDSPGPETEGGHSSEPSQASSRNLLKTAVAKTQDSPSPPDLIEDYYVFQTGHNMVRLEKDIMLLEDARDMIDVWIASLQRRQRGEPSSSPCQEDESA